MGLFSKKKTEQFGEVPTRQLTERCDYCNGTGKPFGGGKCWSCNGVGNKVKR
ncbi:hypothetical protein ABT061_15920 [Streptosporangium sp. NPDC002544]|uniref:hypothetical protein n=1 Tax=Streptosporangium sp. NPDC002544 TaxID=3154538 RepID=UPI003325592F